MSLLRRRPFVSFVVLAYAITWSLQLAAIALARGRDLVLNNEANYASWVQLLSGRLPAGQALPLLLFALGAGPLFAGLIVTWATQGRAGLRDLWQRCTKWNVGVGWYLVVLLLPLLLSGASLGLGLLAAGGEMAYAPLVPLAQILPFLLYMLIFTGVAEEPGWRGVGLPLLQRTRTAWTASWVLGIVLGLWHLPFQIYYTWAADPAADPIVMGVTLLVSLFLLTIGAVGWTIVNTWLYNSTRSVWMAILLHGWTNVVQSYIVLSSGNMTAQAIYGVLPWIPALVLVGMYGRENLARRPRHRAGDLRLEPQAAVAAEAA